MLKYLLETMIGFRNISIDLYIHTSIYTYQMFFMMTFFKWKKLQEDLENIHSYDFYSHNMQRYKYAQKDILDNVTRNVNKIIINQFEIETRTHIPLTLNMDSVCSILECINVLYFQVIIFRPMIGAFTIMLRIEM